jgi:hypothetical protein
VATPWSIRKRAWGSILKRAAKRCTSRGRARSRMEEDTGNLLFGGTRLLDLGKCCKSSAATTHSNRQPAIKILQHRMKNWAWWIAFEEHGGEQECLKGGSVVNDFSVCYFTLLVLVPNFFLRRHFLLSGPTSWNRLASCDRSRADLGSDSGQGLEVR